MIRWDVSPEIFSIGPLTIRWYGFLFALAFIIGFQIMYYIYKKENQPVDELNDLIWYMIIGTVIGARLGHCLFYSPEYYLSNPIKILMIWEGGLASHGASIGILTAIYLYTKKNKKHTFLYLMDRLVITAALGGMFIRLGNLFNSEIIGKPTDVPWAFTFVSIDNIPRHPAQLYEAIACLIIFLMLAYTYLKSKGNFNDGLIFGIFLILLFGFRIFVEYFKENQSDFEQGMILNMGQILSIPLVIAGIFILYRAINKPNSVNSK
ncbi:MAG: prolipoprotein diacylglyceryl transferase [bacterium]